MAHEVPPEASPDSGRMAKALAGTAPALTQGTDLSPASLRNALAALSAVVAEAVRVREEQLAPLKEAANQMAALHAAAKRVHDQVLDALLARGWCHSYHFTDSLIIHLGELASTGRGGELDELMAEFTRQQCARILTAAYEKFPARAAILSDAFEAHRAGKYTLSIPALLIQLDGIGCEVMGLGRNFFHEKRRAGALAALLGGFKWPGREEPYPVGGIHERMLAALERAWGMTADTSLRHPGGEHSPLNRHGVLHGLDTDYPTEFNSLRCVLLIGFVLEVRQALHEDIPGHLREMGERRKPPSA